MIEAEVFLGCKDLKEVQFSERLERIGVNAFAGSGVQDVVLPKSVRNVGAHAFMDCKRLRNVQLNEGLDVLGIREHYNAYCSVGPGICYEG